MRTISKLQNIKHDSYDRRKFSDLFYKTGLSKSITNNVHDYNTVNELVQDSFYTMFQYEPEFEEAGDINSNYHINRTLTEKIMDSPAYRQLRAYTRMNEMNSAMASATLTEDIIKNNRDLIDKLKKQQKAIQKDRNTLKKIKQEYDKLKKNKVAPQQQKILREKMQNILKQIKQTKNGQKKTAKKINVNKALNNTTKIIKKQEEFFDTLGIGKHTGTDKSVDIGSKMDFMSMFTNNDKFKKLMDVFGRLKRLANKIQREKTKYAVETIADIVPSNKIERIIASELINLADPDLEILFDKKFVESELLTYEFEGKGSKGKGPIVICLDVSGSMSGNRDEVAKGVALGLVFIAKLQKRNASVILFDNNVKRTFDFKYDEIMNEKVWVDRMINLAQYFSGGGTNFDRPLEQSIQKFKEKEFKKADLVWVTDGNGNLSNKNIEKFKKLKRDKGIDCYSIIISNNRRGSDHILKEISSKIISVEELTDEVAGDLFEFI